MMFPLKSKPHVLTAELVSSTASCLPEEKAHQIYSLASRRCRKPSSSGLDKIKRMSESSERESAPVPLH